MYKYACAVHCTERAAAAAMLRHDVSRGKCVSERTTAAAAAAVGQGFE